MVVEKEIVRKMERKERKERKEKKKKRKRRKSETKTYTITIIKNKKNTAKINISKFLNFIFYNYFDNIRYFLRDPNSLFNFSLLCEKLNEVD